jgi:hypothetical protein
MPSKKQKINKKFLLKKFLDIPKKGSRMFYVKEMALLNHLISRYSEDFVLALKLPKRYESMAIILCDSYKEYLDKKFREFNYKTNESNYLKFSLHEEKSGEDFVSEVKPKTIRNFLNG